MVEILKSKLLLGALGMMLGATASAIPVNIPANLTLVQSPGVQQNSQGPCVIGDPSCGSNPTITGGFTTLPAGGNVSVYADIFSPIYTVADIIGTLGTSIFSVGIDINQANNAGSFHVLDTFVAEINGNQIYAYSGPTTLNPLNNPGNGFSDWQLDGFDFSNLVGTDTVQFGLDMSGASGGRDQFFLIAADSGSPPPPPPPHNSIPEPPMVALLSLGLFGLAAYRRR